MCIGDMITAPPACAFPKAGPASAGWKTASLPPTPTPISQWPPRSPAGISALPRVDGTANTGSIDLPRGLLEAVALFEDEAALKTVLDETFIGIYAGIKKAEFETFMDVISPWEREYLLLNV